MTSYSSSIRRRLFARAVLLAIALLRKRDDGDDGDNDVRFLFRLEAGAADDAELFRLPSTTIVARLSAVAINSLDILAAVRDLVQTMMLEDR